MYGMGYGGMSGATMSGVGMSQEMNQGGMVHGQMGGSCYRPPICCPPLAAPAAPIGVGAGVGVGVGIIAVAILILIALGVIF